jgi:hypothetical protein
VVVAALVDDKADVCVREGIKPQLHTHTLPRRKTRALLRHLSALETTAVHVLNSYLVDPASSHMLVSKIKPCMSKYKPLYGETADGSLNQ